MPPYDLIHYESLVFSVWIGLGLAIAIILARTARWYSLGEKKTETEIEENIHEFGGGVTERYSPAPLFIWLCAIGYFVWSIGYIVYSGIHGL